MVVKDLDELLAHGVSQDAVQLGQDLVDRLDTAPVAHGAVALHFAELVNQMVGQVAASHVGQASGPLREFVATGRRDSGGDSTQDCRVADSGFLVLRQAESGGAALSRPGETVLEVVDGIEDFLQEATACGSHIA